MPDVPKPFAEFIPVGTLVGAFIRYRELKAGEEGQANA